ncbi:hypothetical protein WA026_016423 [Henosepilachna vigintioctopunctata]|uniref:Large proline-rich protein BAG6 n=1 Tax=Henosepilachna vigintioctopunctata TaxID=420089 RepID=A0AAW1UG86_9CUCU
MINLTVKTLDSRNHQFTVEDDITVERFKQHIADTVNIPAETQRIIYCGRVLQDSSKLNDYDVDGKVVHLVQRPPPSANPPSSRSSRSSSPHPQRRVYRTIDHGNTMFLGSVAFPTNFVDSQGIVPPPPTHSHSGSRLNVARRMLRRAELVIIQLENPNGSTEQTPLEDPQDEVTPVIEARVIVPNNSSEPLDEAAILSAVHNYSLLSGQNRRRATSSTSGLSSPGRSAATNTTSTSNSTDASADPQGPGSSESSSTFPENATRTSSMADLLTMLSQLHLRFAPFLLRYNTFMHEDPAVSSEEARNLQMELNRVSEVMHYLSHAYHALSDIIIRVRTPPPRPLLCRPILIQHSAVLQTGFPIQLEAQINLPTERSPPASQTTPANDTVTSNTTAPTATPQPFSSQGVPVISTVRVPIPLDLSRIVPPQGTASANVSYIRGPASFVQRDDAMNAALTAAMTSTNANAGSAATNTPPSNGAETAPPTSASFGASNPEVEFIMEVSPEGFTFDSLEAGIIGSNQADLLRGALNGQQPPNLLHSIMQMAGQLINRRASAPNSTETPGQSTQSSATSAPPLTPTPPAQNSQARGNNQTNPTSSTNTRSTARPHVHLQQQTMQGGFDPFLPCNSHHVVNRRRQGASNQESTTATPPSGTPRTEQQAQDVNNQLNSLMNTIVNTIRTNYQMRMPAGPASTESPAHSESPPQGTDEGGDRPNGDRTPSAPPAEHPNVPNFGPTSFPDLLRNGPTLAEILQLLPPDDSSPAGESIITDFIMLMSRNLTIGDIISLNGGNISPLTRISGEIQEFFLNTLTNRSRSREAIESGVDRLLTEMQPFLDTLTQIPIRDDIDIEASVRRLFRAKLPHVFQLCTRIGDQPANLRPLVDLFVSVVKEFCALALYACVDGIGGVDRIFEIVATRYMQGIPQDMQEWTLMNSRARLRQLMSNLNVPVQVIEPYIVHKTDTTAQGHVIPQETRKVATSKDSNPWKLKRQLVFHQMDRALRWLPTN